MGEQHCLQRTQFSLTRDQKGAIAPRRRDEALTSQNADQSRLFWGVDYDQAKLTPSSVLWRSLTVIPPCPPVTICPVLTIRPWTMKIRIFCPTSYLVQRRTIQTQELAWAHQAQLGVFHIYQGLSLLKPKCAERSAKKSRSTVNLPI
jgi:hypothetical protein